MVVPSVFRPVLNALFLHQNTICTSNLVSQFIRIHEILFSRHQIESPSSVTRSSTRCTSPGSPHVTWRWASRPARVSAAIHFPTRTTPTRNNRICQPRCNRTKSPSSSSSAVFALYVQTYSPSRPPNRYVFR